MSSLESYEPLIFDADKANRPSDRLLIDRTLLKMNRDDRARMGLAKIDVLDTLIDMVRVVVLGLVSKKLGSLVHFCGLGLGGQNWEKIIRMK